MAPVEQMVQACVGRNVGLVAMGIGLMLLLFCTEPLFAARAAGALSLLLAWVLALRARHAWRRNFRTTQAWQIMKRDQRPHHSFAQPLFARAYYQAYLYYATCAAQTAVIFLSWALVV